MGSIALPVDAVTFEVIRHRLTSIVDEAIVSLENVSGSPITNEGHDMMVSLYRANGDLMVGGVGFLYHLTSASQAVRHLLTRYSSDPGINEGDVYLLNDPYVAALHPPDMYVISPIHVDGTLVGFSANFVHLTDVGAVTPGGFSPDATDTFQEGFVTAGLKLADRGEIRSDVLDTFLNNVRDPGMTALDLKSQMAANHTAQERMRALIQEYGAQTIDAVGDALVGRSEAMLRRRLRELPMGEWRARQYIDTPGDLGRVELTMSRTARGLTFDFAGTSDEAPVGINSTWWGTRGGVFAAVLPLLAWDIDWNDGITRHVAIRAPSASLVNCRRPAPISIATIGVVKIVSTLAATTISKMLDSSEEYRDRATATWKGSHTNFEVFGHRSTRDFFVTLMTDSFAGSGGATSAADGVDLGGEIPNQVARWANVETQELNTPLRYLFRRPITNSGGPGRWRGGVGHELGITPHRALDDRLELGVFGLGVSVPTSLGLAGGYPGGLASYRISRASGEDGTSHKLERVQWGHERLENGDALIVRATGGGGYGDPLEREPRRVAQDIAEGLVGEEVALRVYGVAIVGNAIDGQATNERRRAIRAERIGHPPSREVVPEAHGSPHRISARLHRAADGSTACSSCGALIAPPGVTWKEFARARWRESAWLGSAHEGGSEVALVEYACDACGSLLEVEARRDGDPPLRDQVSRWPETRRGGHARRVSGQRDP